MTDIPQQVKTVGDVVFASTAFGAIIGWLPSIAAGLSIVWFLMQMWSWIIGKKWKRRKWEKP